MSMLKADGYGWRARIGVLTHADQTMSESEFWTMAPDGVSIETQRVPFSDYRTYADPPGPDDATEVLAKLRPQVIVYGFTAAGYLYGAAGEQALIDRLQQHSQGIPVIMPCMSAVAGFRALQARRIALFHPPWYTGDMDDNGRAYFTSEGFEVVQVCHFTPEAAVPHPNYGYIVPPNEMYGWVHKNAPRNIDGLFIAGNGWRTIGVIAALEEDLCIPVLTGSQAPFWNALRCTGVRAQNDDYGQVFKRAADTEVSVSAPRVMAYGN
jgi:maleate isomerase